MGKWIRGGTGVLVVTVWGWTFLSVVVPVASGAMAAEAAQAGAAADSARVAKIIGPEQTENNCATCHAAEAEAWQQTRHFATFNDRHSSERAQAILKAMGERSMKRSTECLTCHYTSLLKGSQVTPQWGVSCESCHGPGKDWNAVHNRPGGKSEADALPWGTGKREPAALRQARLAAGAAKGNDSLANALRDRGELLRMPHRAQRDARQQRRPPRGQRLRSRDLVAGRNPPQLRQLCRRAGQTDEPCGTRERAPPALCGGCGGRFSR